MQSAVAKQMEALGHVPGLVDSLPQHKPLVWWQGLLMLLVQQSGVGNLLWPMLEYCL